MRDDLIYELETLATGINFIASLFSRPPIELVDRERATINRHLRLDLRPRCWVRNEKELKSVNHRVECTTRSVLGERKGYLNLIDCKTNHTPKSINFIHSTFMCLYHPGVEKRFFRLKKHVGRIYGIEVKRRRKRKKHFPQRKLE